MQTTKEIEAELQELDRQIEELQEARRGKRDELVAAIAAQNGNRDQRAALAREEAKRVRERFFVSGVVQ